MSSPRARHWDPRIADDLFAPTSAASDPERLEAAASRLRLPVLLVRGGSSDVISPAGAASFRRAVPHAQYADIEGATHMITGDQNDAFTEALLAFLGRCR